jgi:hypothetical protein
MLPKTRLSLIGLMLIGSGVYAVLVAYDPGVASAVALGYVAFLLTILAAVEFWKKP